MATEMGLVRNSLEAWTWRIGDVCQDFSVGGVKFDYYLKKLGLDALRRVRNQELQIRCTKLIRKTEREDLERHEVESLAIDIAQAISKEDHISNSRHLCQSQWHTQASGSRLTVRR